MTLKKAVNQGDQDQFGKTRRRSQPKRSRHLCLALFQCRKRTVKPLQNLLAMRQKVSAGFACLNALVVLSSSRAPSRRSRALILLLTVETGMPIRRDASEGCHAAVPGQKEPWH